VSAQVAADLRAAADVLERDGWTQEQFTDALGCHCAEGAFMYATPSVERWTAASAALRSYLGAVVITWNDAPGRTAAEVIAALRAAADRAEAEQ